VGNVAWVGVSPEKGCRRQPGLGTPCPVGLDMRFKLTNRQRLDQVLLSVTGEDIRLVGNWERLTGLFGNAEQLAERLNVQKSSHLRCRGNADVFDLMDSEQIDIGVEEGPSLF